MDSPFKDKVYAITGGASGIGLATAKLISEKGGIVCIADANKPALDEVEKYLTDKDPDIQFSVHHVDVADKLRVQLWIADIKRTFGRLDGAANIAGVTGKDHGLKPVQDLDDDEWDTIIGVNLTGTMYCLREELKVIEPKGSIVNMASIHATNGKLRRFGTCAAKEGALVANGFVNRNGKLRRLRSKQARRPRAHQVCRKGKRSA